MKADSVAERFSSWLHGKKSVQSKRIAHNYVYAKDINRLFLTSLHAR